MDRDAAGLSPRTLAERAGVELGFVERLLDLGIIGTDHPRTSAATDGHAGVRRITATDIRRVRVVAGLEQAGLSIDGLAEAIRDGALTLDFVEQPSYDRFAALTDVTFRALSEQRGIPLELVIGVREAMGSTTPSPDDRMRETELPVVRTIELLLEHGVRPEVIGRAIRVYGDSIRRVAETEAEWWGTDILAPLYRAGVPTPQIGRRTASFASELTHAGDELLLALYHGNQSVSWMRNIFEGFESVLARRGSETRLEHPPAIAFLDITSYTRLTEEPGDEAAAELARTLARLVHRSASQQDGRPVKWLGDGVMRATTSAGRSTPPHGSRATRVRARSSSAATSSRRPGRRRSRSRRSGSSS